MPKKSKAAQQVPVGPITLPLQKVYRIHPGIGVARIGNSDAAGALGYFIGPEVPDITFVPAPNGKYRDATGKIRRQGARFRIYEYSYLLTFPITPLTPSHRPVSVREITSADADIQWHVHLANRKSRDMLGHQQVNDPGDKTIGGLNQKVEVIGSTLGEQVKLGTLLTDEAGRLILLGGAGKSRSPSNAPLNGLVNKGWYDDVSDGSVRATIKLHNGSMPAVEPAWVLVGVPDYAHPITSIVTLHDLAYEVATHLPAPNQLVPPASVSFTNDIYPILLRPIMTQWVSQLAQSGHSGAGNFLNSARFNLLKDNNTNPASAAFQARQLVFKKLKPIGNMPPLNGGLKVTAHQYSMFQRWAAGQFTADWTSAPVVQPFNLLTPAQQAQALDMAGLVTTVGGAFSPGIEASGIMGDVTTYQTAFRIRQTLAPGVLTEQLSVPWQADFTLCGDGWWPSGRPNEVTQDGTNFYNWLNFSMAGTVADWWKLGFLAKKTVGNKVIYAETERLAPIP